MKSAWRSLVTTALGVALLPAAGASQSATPAWPDLAIRLQQSDTTASAQDLRALRADLLAALALRDVARQPLLQYSIAYVAGRFAHVPGPTAKERDDLLNDAVSRVQRLIVDEGRDAEAYVLLASLYGAQISLAESKGMTLGVRSSEALERAVRLAPENPRVHLQQGINAFNTPAVYGGGNDRAERSLRRSQDLFARQPVEAPWPNWGRFDSHAWLGQVLQRKGDRAAARAEYDKALAIAPGSGWVRYQLIPALQQGERR
jgi:tetratricopeptide (TPR) repeat protein